MVPVEKVLEIVSKIRQLRNGDAADSMTRMGIIYPINYGVSIPNLKQIAAQYIGSHNLAITLFEQDIRECKILASLIDDPAQVTGEQIDQWSAHFTNIEIVEQVCSNLFWRVEYSLPRSIEWCLGNDPLLIKAGLIITMRCAANSEVSDRTFDPFFEIIENLPEGDEFDYGNYAVGALRQIAKRSSTFREKVQQTSQNLSNSESDVKAWIGNQLLFEFE
jgi:3-methyladenine DNA glycosylase AlkD